MKRILITGGAGFAGSSLAIPLQRHFRTTCDVVCLDNLHRRGSELILNRLKQNGARFVHGNNRIPEDIEAAGPFDLPIECSAEAYVLAACERSPSEEIQTNLSGLKHTHRNWRLTFDICAILEEIHSGIRDRI